MSAGTKSPEMHVVHCVDTEGPLRESLDATFERLRAMYGLDFDTDPMTLRRLQAQEIDLNGLETEVARTLAPDLLAYNDSWAAIDTMLADVMSPAFRERQLDSFGQGWVINWHCLDHVGFVHNPRNRDLGFHRVFDHYRAVLDRYPGTRDAIHFHHHPVTFSRKAHLCATHYFSHAPIVFEILARRIIDRHWFPCVNRPGFHVTRPDSHWFLEQFIPFDFANQASTEDYSRQRDLAGGRFGDWRRAPATWTPYHPSHDDYQVPGQCRRWIARCLNVGTRLRLLTEADVELAYEEAEQNRPVVLAVTNHDFRDIRPDIDRCRDLLADVGRRHPSVRIRYCEAREAMRRAWGMPLDDQGFRLRLERHGTVLRVRATEKTFGPQPFLAIRTISGEYFHDNLDFQMPFHEWSYTLDENNFPPDAVSHVGVAASDEYGNVSVAVLDIGTGLTMDSIQ
jgi:hypothetical protein